MKFEASRTQSEPDRDRLVAEKPVDVLSKVSVSLSSRDSEALSGLALLDFVAS